MNSTQLIKKLGYSDSSAFLQGEQFKEHHGYSFFFTQAEKQDHCNLKGVYTLLDSPDKLSSSSLTPVVYVCEAANEAEAAEIHRRVWNQNIVPFLIVVTPKNIRFYSGFEYDSKKSDEDRVLEVAKNANEVLDSLSELKSESIDSGDIWKQWPISVEGRVDRRLLKDLKSLSEVLTGNKYNLPIEHAHTLIGKYIYLKYLRDRDILSDKRFEMAGINADDIFSNNADKNKLYQLEKYLDGFLNGSVFPLPNKKNIRTEHIKEVACTFKGGDPKSGQRPLFDMYDFSYVPIETLSVVYQQFLHAKDQGRDKGAYYTPVHLVNFILDELEAKKPLKEGMKSFDPSCGSGAFLVQCYRRLVESVVKTKGILKPTELRKLLVDNIFGLDADKKACQVAELSLSLTLLDYIDPPDLSKTNFKLPDLHNKNIFYCEGGFFDEESSWAKSIPKKGYSWIVGNPPWKNIGKLENESDKKAAYWIKKNTNKYPIDNYQLAEAFAWRVTELLSKDGQCGLLMPAMTLFKKQADIFRAKFFSEVETWCIVNFANIRRYLFEGAIDPAAAFFYSGKKDWDKSEHYVTTYAPFAVEQESQLNQKGKTKKIWFVFVNYSTIKEIPLRDIESGSAIPWKMAMWGLCRDKLFTKMLAKRFPALIDYVEQNALPITQGLTLRYEVPKNDKVLLTNELQGKSVLVMDKLKGSRSIHQFSQDAFKMLPQNKDIFTRKGRKDLPLSICNPPHIFVDAARRFVVYSDKFFVIPERQIGIAGNRKQKRLLKALALYLKSEFVTYQQWLTSAAWGIERPRPNLDDLKKLPVPLSKLSDDDLTEWAKLHDEIVEAEKRERKARAKEKENKEGPTLWGRQVDSLPKLDDSLPKLTDLLKRMNDKVYKILGISRKQRWLIEDMLNVRMKLNDGKIATEAIDLATEKEIEKFVRIFQEELDLFLDHSGRKKVHKVKVLYTNSSAVIIVDHLMRSMKTKPEVIEVQDDDVRQELNKLQGKLTETKSQWMYFTRCLQIHQARKTYIFKPRQRLYWLKSQALAEADEFIAEKLATNR